MIRAAVIFLLLAANLLALDNAHMADCLRAKENFNGRDGRRGERGPYQERESVWKMHMPGIPFTEARKEGPARVCALRHIAWLVAQLQARHVDATAFNVAAAWNAGFTGYTTGRAPDCAYLYALDVERLYNTTK